MSSRSRTQLTAASLKARQLQLVCQIQAAPRASLASKQPGACRRKLLQWRFKRQSMVIIAEEQATAGAASAQAGTQLAGSCAVVLKVLDSFLPPPFPTRQPARLYIGNLVVRESQRRQGCGTALLQAVDTLGTPHLAPPQSQSNSHEACSGRTPSVAITTT